MSLLVVLATGLADAPAAREVAGILRGELVSVGAPGGGSPRPRLGAGCFVLFLGLVLRDPVLLEQAVVALTIGLGMNKFVAVLDRACRGRIADQTYPAPVSSLTVGAFEEWMAVSALGAGLGTGHGAPNTEGAGTLCPDPFSVLYG